MKKLLLAMLCGCALFVAGCGKSADENKTPAEIKAEVTSMSKEDIQEMVEVYKAAIADKEAEISKITAEIAKVPITEQMGDKAKELRAKAEELGVSVKRLTENMKAYIEGLSAK